MSRIKTIGLAILGLITLPSQAFAALTLYTTSWSMYGKTPYEYDGAYQVGRPYGQLRYVSNPDMINQFNQADIVAWSFFQAWNSQDPNQAQYQIPASWDGLMHFDDLWGELPLEGSWVSPLPPETNDFLSFCRQTTGACSSIQLNGNTGQRELFHYADQRGVGQLNSFGAFIHSDKIKAKRIIAVGGANTLDNKGVSTATFDAIFANQDKFLTQFKAWMTHFTNLKGIDYDFEPPIDLATGAQLEPDQRTVDDYRNLFKLVQASRAKLGADAYISVTITVNREYLDTIEHSVDGGWFKQIATYADTINLMTYDLHGPWSQSADPYTAVHAYLKQPSTNHRDEFGINYATDDITAQVLGYGMPRNQLQVGLAAYGRGFSSVSAGSNDGLPGFEQRWSGPSQFDEKYSPQTGLLPYKSVPAVMAELGYQRYLLQAPDESNQLVAIGAYLYHPGEKQFIGYQSPEVVKAVCQYIKVQQLKGAIMWSADTDLPVSHPASLVRAFRENC